MRIIEFIRGKITQKYFRYILLQRIEWNYFNISITNTRTLNAPLKACLPDKLIVINE